MLLEDTYKNSALDNEFAIILEDLAIRVNEDLNLLNESILSAIGDSVTDIKNLVQNTFKFIVSGNIFVYVGAKGLSKYVLDKLESFYNKLISLPSDILESLTLLVDMIKLYVSYVIAVGSLMVDNISSRAIEYWDIYVRGIDDTTDTNEAAPTFVKKLLTKYQGIVLEVINDYPKYLKIFGGAMTIGAGGYVIAKNTKAIGAGAAAAAGSVAVGKIKSYVSDKIGSKLKDEDDIGFSSFDITDSIAEEMTKNFTKFAKSNPKLALKFLSDVSKVAPEEFKDSFYTSIKAGVRRGLVRKAKRYLFRLKKIV